VGAVAGAVRGVGCSRDEGREILRLAHFLHVLGIGLAFYGVVDLMTPPRALGIVFFVLAAVAFGAGYMLQRSRSG
jgi:hypothetical protein